MCEKSTASVIFNHERLLPSQDQVQGKYICSNCFYSTLYWKA